MMGLGDSEEDTKLSGGYCCKWKHGLGDTQEMGGEQLCDLRQWCLALNLTFPPIKQELPMI